MIKIKIKIKGKWVELTPQEFTELSREILGIFNDNSKIPTLLPPYQPDIAPYKPEEIPYRPDIYPYYPDVVPYTPYTTRIAPSTAPFTPYIPLYTITCSSKTFDSSGMARS